MVNIDRVLSKSSNTDKVKDESGHDIDSITSTLLCKVISLIKK